MCRLFGMLSAKTTNTSRYLLDDPCSIYAQSNVDPNRRQGDGWGIGFYMDNIPKAIKSEKPVYVEHEKFASAVQAANSRIVIAHVRRASNPRGLPRERLISVENSQPFSHDRYVFVHNGTIRIPDEVADCLGEWKSMIKGVNDSEVYFWYITRHMVECATFPEAMRRFQDDLSVLWQSAKKKSTYDRPYVGLNVLFSDGKALHAYCKYDREDESEVSICLKDEPVLQMSYLSDPTRLIVASEKTNHEEKWRALKSGELLTGQTVGGNIEISRQEI